MQAPSLADIRAFVYITEQGSFTKAAQQLNTSRAQLSRQLIQLEQQLGTQLLIRTTRAQRLTATGELFYNQCKHALAGIQDAIQIAQQDSQQLQGDIAINCVGGVIGEELIANSLSQFSQRYPAINITLDFSSTRVDLISESFDLVIRMGELADSGLIARKLTDIQVQVLASPTYLAKHDPILHPQDLQQHNCLTGSIKRWHFQQKGAAEREHEVLVKGNFSCKNGRALLRGAENGLGIVRLPTLYCQSSITSQALVPVFHREQASPNWQAPDVPLYLLYHRNPLQSQRLALLIAFICQHFENQ